eukprot:16443300-Heterocapsa_arctica.AAC.1
MALCIGCPFTHHCLCYYPTLIIRAPCLYGTPCRIDSALAAEALLGGAKVISNSTDTLSPSCKEEI